MTHEHTTREILNERTPRSEALRRVLRKIGAHANRWQWSFVDYDSELARRVAIHHPWEGARAFASEEVPTVVDLPVALIQPHLYGYVTRQGCDVQFRAGWDERNEVGILWIEPGDWEDYRDRYPALPRHFTYSMEAWEYLNERPDEMIHQLYTKVGQDRAAAWEVAYKAQRALKRARQHRMPTSLHFDRDSSGRWNVTVEGPRKRETAGA